MTAPKAVERSYRAGLDRLRSAQKPGDGVPAYLRWVNRSLGRHAAAAAYQFGLTPNAVTGIGATLSVVGLGAVAFAGATTVGAVAGAALLLLGYALDSADGQLARLTGTGSRAGEWLDHVVDAARLPLTHLAIAYCLFTRGAPAGFVWMSLGFLIAASVWFFGQILAEQLAARDVSRVTAAPWVSFLKLPYDTATLYLVLFLLPWLAGFLVLYTALFAFTLAVGAVSLLRKYRMLRRDQP